MVAPSILRLYTSVWEPMLSNELTGNDIIEFSKRLPKLRDALSCCVCKQLLTNKEALLPTECREHFVCKGCLRKEREDDRKCKRCEDWSTYGEDDSLTDIIKSYQDFCFFFLTSERIVRVLEVKHEVDPKFDTFQLIDLVKEGLKGYQKAKKKRLSCNVARNKGVVPLNVVRRSKKTCEKISAESKNLPEGKNVQSAVAVANDNVGKKVDTKKPVSEGTQDKASKLKCKPNSDTQQQQHATISKFPAPTTTQPTTPATKSLPVVTTSSVTLKTQTTSAASAAVSTFSKSVYSAKAAVKSPPLVTIKVEVQTSPEKQQSPIRQNDGNESPCSSITDPLQDPLGDLPKPPPPPPPPKPILVVSRPPITSNASCITTSVCNTSTLPYRITSTPIVSSQSPMGPQIIQIAHPTGIKTVSIRPQQIRLTGIPGRIPVQLLATAPGTSSSHTTAESLRTPLITRPQTGSPTTSTSPALKRRIIFTTATPHDLQRWPDTNKVLQFATGDLSRFPALAGITPSLISVGQSCPITGIRTSVSTTNVRPVVATASLPLVRPPSTSGVITTSGQTFFTTNSISHQGAAQVHSSGLSFVRSVGPTMNATPVGSVPRPPQGYTPTTTTVTRQVPVVSSPSTTSPVLPLKRKPEGCRCGNATPTPGKLTCIGQRCACYADRNACSDCKCKGCKNPYVPGSGGKKVLHGVRAYLDPQTSQGIPFIATPMGQGASRSAVVTGIPNSTVTQTNPQLVTAVGPSPSFGTIQTGIPTSVSSNTVPPFQFIPVRFGPNGTPQYLQITNPQALQQMPIILSTSGHLQTNSSGITIQGIPMSGLSASGLHQQISQMQQQRLAQMNIKPERNPQQE